MKSAIKALLMRRLLSEFMLLPIHVFAHPCFCPIKLLNIRADQQCFDPGNHIG